MWGAKGLSEWGGGVGCPAESVTEAVGAGRGHQISRAVTVGFCHQQAALGWWQNGGIKYSLYWLNGGIKYSLYLFTEQETLIIDSECRRSSQIWGSEVLLGSPDTSAVKAKAALPCQALLCMYVHVWLWSWRERKEGSLLLWWRGERGRSEQDPMLLGPVPVLKEGWLIVFSAWNWRPIVSHVSALCSTWWPVPDCQCCARQCTEKLRRQWT